MTLYTVTDQPSHRVVDELRKRFAEFLKTDNDAVVHPDLLRVTYRIVRGTQTLTSC